MASSSRTGGLTVAITGPTGDIGRSVVRALERSREVGRIVGMARRPFDPAEHGWKRTEYRRGDVLDRDSVDALVAERRRRRPPRVPDLREPRGDARGQPARLAQRLRGGGRRRRPKRLVYTSSVAAYGFHRGQPRRPHRGRRAARGTPDFYYSAQKAELESLLGRVDRRLRHRRRMCSGPASSPDPTRPRWSRDSPARRCSARACACCGACSTRCRWSPRAARQRRAVPARSPRRRRRRGPRRGARARRSRAPTTSPATPRSRSATWPTRSAGMRCRCRRAVVGGRRQCSPESRSLRRRRAGSTPSAKAGADGQRQGRKELRWRARHDAMETLKETVRAAQAAGIVQVPGPRSQVPGPRSQVTGSGVRLFCRLPTADCRLPLTSRPLDWKAGVVYQIYPRSFADSDGDGVGDLEGITGRLDHLCELGVEALWLSPIYPSPMADFGYDVSDYSDVDPLFGSLETFDRLVLAAHERGLRVLLDLVPCHTSDRAPVVPRASGLVHLGRLGGRTAQQLALAFGGPGLVAAPATAGAGTCIRSIRSSRTWTGTTRRSCGRCRTCCASG